MGWYYAGSSGEICAEFFTFNLKHLLSMTVYHFEWYEPRAGNQQYYFLSQSTSLEGLRVEVVGLFELFK